MNTAGSTIFTAGVGSLVPLTSLTTDAAGTTTIAGPAVTTTGAQVYNDAVVLAGNVVLSSSGAGNLIFASTIDGAFSLGVNTAGLSIFGGFVGEKWPSIGAGDETRGGVAVERPLKRALQHVALGAVVVDDA